MSSVLINVSPAQSPREGLLLWGAKVTKAPVGKRLLYARGHTAQAFRTTGWDLLPHLRSHRPALLQNLQSLFPTHKPPLFFPLWPKLFADVRREARIESQETRTKTVLSRTIRKRWPRRKSGAVKWICVVELFCVLIFWLLLDQAKSNSQPAAIERD